ncbi:MAG: vWA domain-containing protein [Eubacteriaceae bacterium]
MGIISKEKNNKKRIRNRRLVFVLILAIVFGNIPSEVLAKSGDSGYAIYKNPDSVTVLDDGVTYQKSIASVKDDPYAFDITLDVTTNQKVEVIDKGADVVLVIDISGSMATQYNGKTLLASTKEATKIFADSFLNASPSSRLGLVTYDNMVDKTNFGSYSNPVYLTNDLDTFKKEVDRIAFFNGGTYTQGGIIAGQEILNAQSSSEYKYLLVFSDGEPNYALKGVNPTWVTPEDKISPVGTVDMKLKFGGFDPNFGISRYYGNYGEFGEVKIGQAYIPTVAQALLAKENHNIDVFSVLFDNQVWFNGDTLKFNQAQFTMKNVATNGQYYLAENTVQLADDFEKIGVDIIVGANSWRITDPMPDGGYVIFDQTAEVSINGNNTYTGNSLPPGVTFEENNLQWNMLDPRQPEPIEIRDGDGKISGYRYTMTYRIKIDPDRNPPTTPIETNGKTTLDYFVGDPNDFDPNNSGSYQTVIFEVPQVIDKNSASKSILVKAKNMVAYQGGTSLSGDVFPSPYYELYLYDENGNLDHTPLSQEEMASLSFTVDGSPVTDPYYLYGIPYRAYFVKDGKAYNYLPGDENSPITYEEPGVYEIKLTTKPVDGGYHDPGATSSTGVGRIEENKTFRLTTDNLAPGILEVRAKDTVNPPSFTPYIPDSGLPTQHPLLEPQVSIPKNTTFVNSAGIVVGSVYEHVPNLSLMGDRVIKETNVALINETLLGDSTLDMKNKTIGMAYMDLVDHNNGNIIVTAQNEKSELQTVGIYYPYPLGTDKNTLGGFQVAHFPEIKRTLQDSNTGYEVLKNVQLLDEGIYFEVTEFGAFAFIYTQQPLYFNLAKELKKSDGSLGEPGTELEKFVFKIEYLGANQGREAENHVGLKTFYTVLTIDKGEEQTSEIIKVTQPGIYQITEMNSNWRYSIQSPVENLVRIEVLATDSDPENEGLKKATFANYKAKTIGLGAKSSVTNHMVVK